MGTQCTPEQRSFHPQRHLPAARVVFDRKLRICFGWGLRTSDWRSFIAGPSCWLFRQGGGSAQCTDGRRGCG